MYDVRGDPNEWVNLAQNPSFDNVKARLAAEAPQAFAQPGLAKDKLKLVIDGERYNWTEK